MRDHLGESNSENLTIPYSPAIMTPTSNSSGRISPRISHGPADINKHSTHTHTYTPPPSTPRILHTICHSSPSIDAPISACKKPAGTLQNLPPPTHEEAMSKALAQTEESQQDAPALQEVPRDEIWRRDRETLSSYTRVQYSRILHIVLSFSASCAHSISILRPPALPILPSSLRTVPLQQPLPLVAKVERHSEDLCSTRRLTNHTKTSWWEFQLIS